MGELKPCPFCGSEAVIEDLGGPSVFGDGRYFVKCTNPKCGEEQSGLWATKQTAIKRWNKRAKTEDQFDRNEFRQFLNDKAWEIANKRAEANDEHTD